MTTHNNILIRIEVRDRDGRRRSRRCGSSAADDGQGASDLACAARHDRRRPKPSVIRAAHYGFSLMLAIIGGSPARFAPFSQLFQQALERFGRAPLPVGVHSPGHVAVTDEKARDEFWPRYLEVIRSVSSLLDVG
jgi:hypothetical protein